MTDFKLSKLQKVIIFEKVADTLEKDYKKDGVPIINQNEFIEVIMKLTMMETVDILSQSGRTTK